MSASPAANSFDNRSIAQDLKYLYCINVNPANTCCCGCTLRMGVKILGWLWLIASVLNTISILGQLISAFNFGFIIGIVENLALVYASLLLLRSTNDNDFVTAYKSYRIVQLLVFISVPLAIIKTLFISTDPAVLSIVILVLILSLCLSLYYLHVIYSFTKQLGLGNLAAIDGQDQQTMGVTVQGIPVYTQPAQGIPIQHNQPVFIQNHQYQPQQAEPIKAEQPRYQYPTAQPSSYCELHDESITKETK